MSGLGLGVGLEYQGEPGESQRPDQAIKQPNDQPPKNRAIQISFVGLGGQVEIWSFATTKKKLN